MNADLLILVILSVYTLILVFTKTHVAFITLALSSGYLLSTEVGPGLVDFITNTSEAVETLPIFTLTSLFLLLIPAVIIGYRFRKSQKGSSRFMQQLVPAFALALLLVIFIFDFLPEKAKIFIADEAYFYGQLDLLRGWIIAFAVFSSLFDIMVQHAGPPRDYKKRKKSDK